MDCTIRQAVGIWDELVDAYYGRNGYGGQTAEIYSYRLEQYSPGVHKFSDDKILPMYRDDAKRIAIEAAQALAGIIKLFLERYDAEITVENMKIPIWEKKIKQGKFLYHRYHVTVLRKDEC